MQVGPEFSRLGLASHRGDDSTPDDDGAQVAPVGLGDVLLQDDVLAHGPERLEKRGHRLGRLGDHGADALRALLELHDAGRAAHVRERLVDRVGRARAHGHRDVDVSLGQELHRSELVARARDRERRVEHGNSHEVELTHDGEAVVRDRGSDARQDEVRVAYGLIAEIEGGAAS